jgi:diacylglycerol kinase family enzyme
VRVPGLSRPHRETRRRIAAALAFTLGVLALVLAAIAIAGEVWRGALVLVLISIAAPLAWSGLIRVGAARLIRLLAAAITAGVAIGITASGGSVLENLLVIGIAAAAVVAAGTAFRIHVTLPEAPRPSRPVLFFNPRSGGGKAERFKLADEARARGIEPLELHAGSDLAEMTQRAIDGGADAIAMAGGDGSQAVVAAAAARRSLPYACIPAGTRNHFALDLGVDREDVVGALEAFVDGGERQVDLAEVNGRVFVNNVSLGLYAEAVQKAGYRDAKIRTLLETMPEAVGEGPASPRLTWRGSGGETQTGSVTILVSNNRYRLGRAIGSGARPTLAGGVLGIAAVEAHPRSSGTRFGPPWRQWSALSFEIEAERPVPAGIDGEAVMLEPPLRFRILPGALRVRVSRAHPGASPAAIVPEVPWAAFPALLRIAAGREAPR